MKHNLIKIFPRAVLVLAAAAALLCLLIFGDGQKNDPVSQVKASGLNLPLPVLSIQGDEDDFWGYENGILIPGKAFDDYKAAQVASGAMTQEEADALIPLDTTDANFNHKEWIKKAQVTLTMPDGEALIHESVGLRISGNASRKLAQKSLMLIADKKDYQSEANAFYLNLGRSDVDSYKKLRVHSGGQDERETQLRCQLISAMAERTGISPVREEMPVLVYINDAFYGIAHLENPVSDSYLGAYYGIDSDHIQVMEGGIGDCLDALWNGVEFDDEKQCFVTADHGAAGYDCSDFGWADFSDASLREKFEDRVDVDNMMSYFSFNMALYNYDWPHNNVLVWRYDGPAVDGVPETDGRWRFLLTDMDVCLMGDKSDPFDELNWNGASENWAFFARVLEYQPYKDLFVNDLMDEMTLALDPDFVTETVADLDASYGDCFAYAQAATQDETLRGYLAGHGDSVARLLDCTLNRSNRLKDYLYQYYDAGEGYTLRLMPCEGGTIHASGLTSGDQPLESLRSCGCKVPVHAEVAEGYEFDCWLINGVPVENGPEDLELSADQAENQILTLELRCRKK